MYMIIYNKYSHMHYSSVCVYMDCSTVLSATVLKSLRAVHACQRRHRPFSCRMKNVVMFTYIYIYIQHMLYTLSHIT